MHEALNNQNLCVYFNPNGSYEGFGSEISFRGRGVGSVVTNLQVPGIDLMRPSSAGPNAGPAPSNDSSATKLALFPGVLDVV
jgi:hypothetical protein